ncbi:SAM-dependent methyltransferase [uncultured Mycobacterium sp.]|uniref:SAM-dependent methyltransferase n=1 Tax=uncultured Mycobacterium sp. TaxID=171292 RepID=UPI0035C9455D
MSTGRTDDDTWDIATSVGATAVMVAAARAEETASEQPLIRDEFAQILIDGPELSDLVTRMSRTYEADPEIAAVHRHMVDYQAARTHFFDAYFTAAAEAGIRQHVILAAGLDSRAYRLNWPPGTTVYEVDQPKVLEYKAVTLVAHGAQPSADRREVPADLRFDWLKTLRDKGFDVTQPTAWLAEGLLMFLPGEAEERLFADIDTLSAPGSLACIEEFSLDDAARAAYQKRRAKTDELRKRLGDENVFDPGDLWYTDDERRDPARWFETHGWRVQSLAGSDYLTRVGRDLPQNPDIEATFRALFVSAEKPQETTS